MLFMPFFLIAIAFAALGGVLRVAVPLILAAAAIRRQRATMTAQLPGVPDAAMANPTLHPQPLPAALVQPPPVILPPATPPTGGDIYMPGGPAVQNGRVFVPGMTPTWKR